MHAPLTTERQKYYHLYALVCEDLPAKAVDTLVRQGHAGTTETLRAVRQSRKPHLAWLIDLIKVGLPDFSIPKQLLPATPARVVAPVLDL